jgi:hypothetical protein
MVGVQDAATTFLVHATFEKQTAEGRNAEPAPAYASDAELPFHPERLRRPGWGLVPPSSPGWVPLRRHTLSGLCNQASKEPGRIQGLARLRYTCRRAPAQVNNLGNPLRRLALPTRIDNGSLSPQR